MTEKERILLERQILTALRSGDLPAWVLANMIRNNTDWYPDMWNYDDVRANDPTADYEVEKSTLTDEECVEILEQVMQVRVEGTNEMISDVILNRSNLSKEKK